MNLIISLFIDNSTRGKFVKALKEHKGTIDEGVLSDKLLDLAKDNINEYFTTLGVEVRKDISSKWKYKDYDKSIIDFLTSREGLDDEKSKKEFKEKIESLIDEKMDMAKDQFANTYKLSTKNVFSK